MRLEFISTLPELSLQTPGRIIDLLILCLYVLLLFVAICRRRSDFGELGFRRAGVLILLLLAGFALPLVARMRFPAEGLSWSGLLSPQAEIAIPLFASLPIVLAALYLGPAPAALVGLSAGVSYASSLSLTWTQAFEGAFFGLLLGLLLYQKTRTGNRFAPLRQPVVATPLLSLLVWPIPLYIHLMNPALWAGDSTWALPLLKLSLPSVAAGFLVGSVAQVLLLAAPRGKKGRRERRAERPQGRQRTVAGRILSLLVPLNLVAALVLVVVVNVVTMNVAFQRSLSEMEKAAGDAADQIVTVAQHGITAANELVASSGFPQIAEDDWPTALEAASIEGFPFQQLLLLRADGSVMATRSSSAEGPSVLSEEEMAAFQQASANRRSVPSNVFRLQGALPTLSVVAPIVELPSRQVRGALVGRLALGQTPQMRLALDMIGGEALADRALIIDERGEVVLSTGQGDLLTSWAANPSPRRRFATSTGQAYEESDPDGGLRLVYWLPVSQPEWHLVIERSRSSISRDAGRLATPLLLSLAGIFALLTAGSVAVVRYQLIDLGRLAIAATHIAQGGLNTPLPALQHRQDEIGVLTRAIQQMTASIGTGVEELARLVEVSQNVSARTNLGQTLQILLRALTRGMTARSAGICLVNPRGEVRHVAAEGDAAVPADIQIYLEHTTRQVWRTAGQIVLADVEGQVSPDHREALLRCGIHSMVVMPMLREGRTIGTLWAHWDKRRDFSRTDLNFFAALSNLAGIMIDNNHIYRAVESERSRLVAILTSTRDGILVTDAQGRLQLANPAAQELLGFDSRTSVGQPLPKIISSEPLYRMLSDTARGRGASTVELEHADRRLYVSASTIDLRGKNGPPQGWVLVMRDVTDIKRLDTMKTDFLNTVTHNMKSPLTYVRGYASMLHVVGQVNDKQGEYVEKILKGIDDLTQLIDDLTELGHISNRVGLTMTPCNLVTIAAEVAQMQRSYAEGKGLTFHTEFPASVPDIIGDPRWLRQAIRNLVDNAIKYTMPPGWIKVSVQELTASIVVAVADSGVGVAPADTRRIFEQFYRVRRKETLHIHGTGLGLALVKKVAEQHGGRVWVDSELGAGSVFYLGIPKERRIADLLDEDGLLSTPSADGSRREEPAPRVGARTAFPGTLRGTGGDAPRRAPGSRQGPRTRPTTRQ